MYSKEEVVSYIKESFNTEEQISEIEKTLEETSQIGHLNIIENVWNFKCEGVNYYIFNNNDHAERIAINVIESKIQNKDSDLDDGILFKNLDWGNLEGFTYSKAQRKYNYMDSDDLARDYRSHLRRGEKYSEHKIFEARNMAINTYSNELMEKISSDPQEYFQSEGLYSAFDVTNRYSNFWINSNSAATDIVNRNGWGRHLELYDENMTVIGPGMILVRSWN